MDDNFLHLKSRFSVSLVALSYLYWKIQNPTPRRKIEFLTDCCFNFQFNLPANEYINSIGDDDDDDDGDFYMMMMMVMMMMMMMMMMMI